MNKQRLTAQFKKDVELARKRGKDTTKLQKAMAALVQGDRLDQSYRPHRLSGYWAGSWECHVGPDWLLIWNDEDPGVILFQRTGTHSDLFKS